MRDIVACKISISTVKDQTPTSNVSTDVCLVAYAYLAPAPRPGQGIIVQAPPSSWLHPSLSPFLPLSFFPLRESSQLIVLSFENMSLEFYFHGGIERYLSSRFLWIVVQETQKIRKYPE